MENTTTTKYKFRYDTASVELKIDHSVLTKAKAAALLKKNHIWNGVKYYNEDACPINEIAKKWATGLLVLSTNLSMEGILESIELGETLIPKDIFNGYNGVEIISFTPIPENDPFAIDHKKSLNKK